MPLDFARNDNDPGLAPLRTDRLALAMRDVQVRRPPRRHVLWRDPREVRTSVGMILLMIVGGWLGGHAIAAVLMNEAVLAFLGIVP